MLTLNDLSAFAFAYFVFFCAIIGLCVGSFLNVVILRGLSGESIVLPPSKCPKCSNKLKWYDNIPVFSYLFLGGKCRYCKEHISLQYPIVEILTSVLFVLMFLKFDFTLTTLFMWVFVALFVVMSVTDIKEQVIITHHAYFLTVAGVLYSWIVNNDVLNSVLGVFAGVLVMEILARTGLLCFQKRAFGEGDSYIGAAIGAIIGWKMFLYSLVIAVVLQAVLILPLFIFKIIQSKKYKLVLTLLGFVAVALYMYFNQYMPFVQNIVIIILLIAFGLASVGQVFAYARENELQTIPFGPAMLIGAFICIYFDKFISAFLF